MRPSTVALILSLAHAISGMRITDGSPCSNVCGPPSNTTSDDIVCHDQDYFQSDVGIKFKKCVSCELQSTFNKPRTGESDVEWGLYNLRFAFSSCIYGFPAEKQSLSTPCQVSCASLSSAIEYNLLNPNGFTTYDFCGMSTFGDLDVTKCMLCYGLTDNEKILANFVETLRQGCHSKIPEGAHFVVDPTRIFNTTTLPPLVPSPTPSTATSGGHAIGNLILIIILPLLGLLLVLAGLCAGCFILIRRRRRRAKRRDGSQYLHERWNDTGIMSPTTPGFGSQWGDPPQSAVYSPSFHNAPYYGGASEVKYPPGAYVLGTSTPPAAPAPLTSKEIEIKKKVDVPILSPPPPPRKSMSKD